MAYMKVYMKGWNRTSQAYFLGGGGLGGGLFYVVTQHRNCRHCALGSCISLTSIVVTVQCAHGIAVTLDGPLGITVAAPKNSCFCAPLPVIYFAQDTCPSNCYCPHVTIILDSGVLLSGTGWMLM
jgi:hypothetical protein